MIGQPRADRHEPRSHHQVAMYECLGVNSKGAVNDFWNAKLVIRITMITGHQDGRSCGKPVISCSVLHASVLNGRNYTKLSRNLRKSP